jgi:hypothetical protein
VILKVTRLGMGLRQLAALESQQQVQVAPGAMRQLQLGLAAKAPADSELVTLQVQAMEVIRQAWRFVAELQGYRRVARRRQPVRLHWTAR